MGLREQTRLATGLECSNEAGAAVGSGQVVAEVVWGDAMVGEDAREFGGGDAHVMETGFGEEVAVVGGDGEVAAFVKFFFGEARPVAEDASATDAAAEGEEGGPVSVIGASVSILAGGASEFAHGEDEDLRHAGTPVAVEGGEAFGEFAQAGGESSASGALVVVGVPAAELDEGDFEADVGFDKLGDLTEGLSEGAAGVLGVVFGVVIAILDFPDFGEGCESLTAGFAGGVFNHGRILRGVRGEVKAGEEFFRGLRGGGVGRGASGDIEAVEIGNGEGGCGTLKAERHFRGEGNGADLCAVGGVFRAAADKAVEPSGRECAGTGDARLHEILGFEVGATGTGIAAGREDGEFSGVIERGEWGEGGVEAEVPVEVDCLFGG